MQYDRLFPALPDEARLWIYTASRPLSTGDQASLNAALEAFFDQWTSHGRPVTGAAEVLYDRFLVVAAHIPGGDLSGCGIDASVNAFDDAARRLGITWEPALSVSFRNDAGGVQVLPRPAFRERVRAGTVTAATTVFDTSLSTLVALRSGQFEQPAGAAWHARVFRIPQPAS